MTARWNVDLHSHTLWSKDCLVSFETIIRLCRQRGIDRIAITDHNTVDGALLMARLAPDLVIPGEEIMTTHGEILAYYVRETVPAGLSPEETIRRLRDQGAVISVSHPFDRLRKGAWERADLEAIAGRIDAVEIFNSRCIYAADNALAESFAEAHDLPGTAGSDAHSAVEYGQGLARLRPFDDPASLRESLRDAEYVRRLSPSHVHFASTYAKWMKRLGLRRRQWAGG